MTKLQLAAAVGLAKSDDELAGEDTSPFDGFGLPDFKPVYVTIRQVAKLVRWQAQYLSGGFDQEAIQEIANHGRQRFMIVDPVS